MNKKNFKFLNLLMVCSVGMICALLGISAIQLRHGISPLQVIWISLLLSQNIVTLLLIPQIKRKLTLTRGK